MSNKFGKIYSFTSFGESHAEAIGGVIDGVPAGHLIDIEGIQLQLDRRRPGQSDISSQRNEPDKLKILSGIFNGLTTGAPIGFIVENLSHNKSDYENLRNIYRPSHADYTYEIKYGIHDFYGGGRSSARETVARIVAGSLARQILKSQGISITAYTSSIGDLKLKKSYKELDLASIDNNSVRCPDEKMAKRMEEEILAIKKSGDTIGGVITCVINGVPAGIGEPIYGKLHAQLAAAMMSINAAKGFEYGMGFEGCGHKGSEMIDNFEFSDNKFKTKTNHSGGIQGGISNGEDIYFNVAFKPVATLLRDIETVDKDGRPIILSMKGRHDPCVVPRAVPIVESMAACVILDNLLINRMSRL